MIPEKVFIRKKIRMHNGPPTYDSDFDLRSESSCGRDDADFDHNVDKSVESEIESESDMEANMAKLGDCMPMKSDNTHYQIECYGGGRPKKARRIDPDEKGEKRQKMKAKIQMKMKRQQTSLKCGKCGNVGHNARSCGKKNLSDAKKDQSPLAKASRTILQIKRANAARQEKAAKAIAKKAKENEREAKKQKQGLSIDKQVKKQGSTSTIEKEKEGPSMAPPAPFVEETDLDDEGFVSQLTQEFCATPQPEMTKGPTPLEQLKMGLGDDSYFRGKQLEAINARDGTPAMFERIQNDLSFGSSSQKLKQIKKEKGENSRKN
ncbi:zinc knuckle (CCHC-type) family protein [Striga asiatica]|uniref:Zinc knuckle (CCHC-type) family protein n=1 Tax=Striga asiatica TaxID=4170 RepID=A0A5A7RGQ7_STRAF|nr:zinc knuckle (CCHC-type) family protein [Striga asiatica]